MRPGRAGHSEELRAAVVAALASHTVADIAEAYGIGTSTIGAWRKAAGIPNRPPGFAKGCKP